MNYICKHTQSNICIFSKLISLAWQTWDGGLARLQNNDAREGEECESDIVVSTSSGKGGAVIYKQLYSITLIIYKYTY